MPVSVIVTEEENMDQKQERKNRRTWFAVAIGLVMIAGAAFGVGILLNHPMSVAADLIVVDGMAVPDIGPLPTSVPMPPSNINYKAKVELGKLLYFDGRLSKNGMISCAFCHTPGSGFADARQTSTGMDGKVGGRQAPTVLNTAFNHVQFWDGRASSLEEQAIGPIHNPIEMGETHEHVAVKLGKIKGYKQQFQAVFGTDVNLQGVADAIAAYERTLISTNSNFDKYVMGNKRAMTESAIRGMAVFKGKGRCILCHNGPNFTDNQFHNLGVLQVGPLKEDSGRYNVTHDERDKGAFKTPTLRSITETAPYMHDGVFKTLEEVVEFYDQGGGANANLSPLVKPLQLTKEVKADLVEFLKALTGEPIKFVMPKLP